MMTVTGKKTVKMMRNMKSSGEKRSVWEMLDRVDKTFISVQGEGEIRHRGTWLAGR